MNHRGDAYRLLPKTGHIEDRDLKFLLQEILKLIDEMNDRLDVIEEELDTLEAQSYTTDYGGVP